ncbi:FKBP-type peptidyl-prolyl cis-trans isomerase [Fibrella aquatica]|jgi:FKBP-type peptidyl-prolyl cis-trans isomerase SlyD|uniref:FKBP-type peptidyl-prolyl cis-trans isomerase n=1 Tax=Fibrella aquatica TaxID=3242487 RepID=UPI003522458D
MHITKHKVAAIRYTLRNDAGVVLDSSEGGEPLYYLHGENNLIPGMEEGLEGRQAGDKLNLVIPPEKGYGILDPKNIHQVPASAFGGSPVEVGMQFQADDGMVVTVKEVGPTSVTIDANHELAGETLHFDIEVVEVRNASDDELSHGHAHGPGGHH